MDKKRKLLGIFEKILKIFDENSIEKLHFYFIFIFYFIFRKFVTKNRAFGNNTSFLQQFFSFGGGDFPPSPLATPLFRIIKGSHLTIRSSLIFIKIRILLKEILRN